MKQMMWDLISAGYVLLTCGLFFGMIVLGCMMQGYYGEPGFSFLRGVIIATVLVISFCIIAGLYGEWK